MKQISKMSPNELPVTCNERKVLEVEHNEGKLSLGKRKKNLTRWGGRKKK